MVGNFTISQGADSTTGPAQSPSDLYGPWQRRGPRQTKAVA